jgi:hypothetical protein
MGATRLAWRAIMANRIIHLPLGLAELEQWDQWDCALAFAVLIPRLIAPATGKRRVGIRAIFYSALLERLEAAATDPKAVKMQVFLKQYLAEHRHSLHRRSGIDNYLRRLHLGQRKGKYIRSILTVGLTAKVMASPEGAADGRRVLSTAQQYIIDNYETGPTVYSNWQMTRTAWFEWKRVAHLCAALVDYLSLDGGSPRIDEETLNGIEADMATFAVTAASYQAFLTSQTVVERAEIPARTQQAMKLTRLPELRLLAPGRRNDSLPQWGRRTATAPPR